MMQFYGQLGGVFALLVFWHVAADWLPQSHFEAMMKSKNRLVRAEHCGKYALAYLPVGIIVNQPLRSLVLALGILFVSHYIIDSYVPVMLWAKYLRKAPEFRYVVPPPVLTPEQVVARATLDSTVVSRYDVVGATYADDVEAFKAFASTPLGLVLMITMDQFFHVAFLLPVAWLLVK